VALRNHSFSINEFYHLYSRGVDKKVVFLDESDRKRFIKLLYFCNGTRRIVYREIKDLPLLSVEKGECIVAVGAYCIMGNHFHLLVKEIQEGGISVFMKKLLTAYSSYFNKKYEREGPLFQSTFRSQHLNSDEYLKYVFSYIHLNPMKFLDSNWRTKAVDVHKAEEFLIGYGNSSYTDYRSDDGREEACILNRLAFPDYFPNGASFSEEITGWLSYPQSP